MSEYRTVFRPEAQAELRKAPRDMALRILAKLTELKGTRSDSAPRRLCPNPIAVASGSATTASSTTIDKVNWSCGSFRSDTAPRSTRHEVPSTARRDLPPARLLPARDE